MTTNVLVAAPHNCAGKLVRVEKYDPTLPEASRIYTVVADLEQGQCEMDWGACIHGNQSLRITEVEALPDIIKALPAVAAQAEVGMVPEVEADPAVGEPTSSASDTAEVS